MNLRTCALGTASLLVLFASLGACTATITPPQGTGGAPVGTGGATSGGGSGGVFGSGGAASGGTSSGGAASGGAASGGTSSGGAASGGTTSGSGGENFMAIDNGPTFQFVRKIVTSWINNCQGCHGGLPDVIDLRPDPGLYDRLLNGVSNDICLNESSMPMELIVPGEPENSGFLRILKEPCNTGDRMPKACIDGSDCLTAEYIGYIEQWITDGALDN